MSTFIRSPLCLAMLATPASQRTAQQIRAAWHEEWLLKAREWAEWAETSMFPERCHEQAAICEQRAEGVQIIL